jgi:hypothetical protein
MKKRRWLIAMIEAAEDETVILPWSRRKGRAKRKAAARARAMAA